MSKEELIETLKSLTDVLNNRVIGSSSIVDVPYFDGKYDGSYSLQKADLYFFKIKLFIVAAGLEDDQVKIANFGGHLTSDALFWFATTIKDKSLTYEQLVKKFEEKYLPESKTKYCEWPLLTVNKNRIL
ncbi:hypothetical protein CANARDRAFT_97405 [[Candida] arabinofermentans NRRL YB-2248]|uniref:Uncharacterized protein n=1 Tax=[Candida] arabinofermentans NRRL YB-2248 TaxID=983967 RepID=A0A1E4T707_9ASCO|nr:hypothetical protein CANARDRAFT_97405 [[Candida] arabinofermentans NRRL YB-2248]